MICLFLDFTGYVLRWDEGIRWALVAGTNLVKSIPVIGPGLYGMLVGGSQPGAATLVRFYAWHIFGLTLAAGPGRRLAPVPRAPRRRDRRAAAGRAPLTTGASRRFELVRREGLAALLTTVLLIVLALVRPAPIGPAIQEGDFHWRRWARALVLPVGAAAPAPGRPLSVGCPGPPGDPGLAGHHPLPTSGSQPAGAGRRGSRAATAWRRCRWS